MVLLAATLGSLALSASWPLSFGVRGSALQPTVLRGALRLPTRPAIRMMAGDADKPKDDDERLGAGSKGGHQVRGAPTLSPEEQKVQAAVMEHQKGAARLSQAEDARSLVGYSSGYAVLSTLSKQLDGYPSGSLVGFATDDKGLPVFCFSAMSSHTQDLMRDSAGAKAALTVTASGFSGAADGRVSLLGDVARIKDQPEIDELRTLYRQKHPDAFWTDFGDFSWWRMKELKAVRFVGGFARAGDISPTDYQAAAVDSIQAFAKPVIGHMNDDHSESTIAMVMHYIGLNKVEKAELVALDRLGFTVQVTRLGQTFKLRLPFPRAAESRKDVKGLIVEMTQASMSDAAVQSWLGELKAGVSAAAGEPAKATA